MQTLEWRGEYLIAMRKIVRVYNIFVELQLRALLRTLFGTVRYCIIFALP